MFQNKKGQITIEFVVILGVILLFLVYFSSSIYPLIHVDKSIYLLKQNALEIISEYNYPITISLITFDFDEGKINFYMTFNKNIGPLEEDLEETLLNKDLYNNTLEYIKNSTPYTDANVFFTYN